ncbi:MarR family winged helix-turn-helix transcriptional regulator [Actinomadura opuntiae]|uniref:MarR family winged helix-turn-helix transcriptional regulator n=1 Tax=Actinomadura sp. OS1-43 TaxID=604315 RepID=UPI00255AB55E|nr:MarR family winged helix-turn-helix transcriptional regulator [Actinomadura sp. OS1-43]MDL4817950.1 MarR family winged helix-turn-helix transcriptional regulator [Actinomadura sp. OS1-43]
MSGKSGAAAGADAGTGTGVDADLEAMVQIMGRMFRGMKGSAAHGEAEELTGLVKDAGLGPRHVPVLIRLVLDGPVPVGVLARHLALSPATVSQLVGELQRGGFVVRRPDERDRRRMIVSLDEERRDLVERFAWRRLRPLRMTLEALGPLEREHFLHGWRTLVEMMERAAREDPLGGGVSRGA